MSFFETKIVADGPNAARVELVIADAASLEAATETIVVCVNVSLDSEASPLLDYQRRALVRTSDIVAEHWRALDKILGH